MLNNTNNNTKILDKTNINTKPTTSIYNGYISITSKMGGIRNSNTNHTFTKNNKKKVKSKKITFI